MTTAGTSAPQSQRQFSAYSPSHARRGKSRYRPSGWKATQTQDIPCSTVWQAGNHIPDVRQFPRRSLRCPLTLADAAEPSTDSVGFSHDDMLLIRAECRNVSQNGLYAEVPIGFGVAKGQQYVFHLDFGENGPSPGGEHVVQPGTVVRTELLIAENGEEDRVGIGVRLHGHRVGVMPLPMVNW